MLPSPLIIVARTSDGAEHPLLIQGKNVVPGERATTFSARLVGPNSLTLTDNVGRISAAGGGLEVTGENATTLVIEDVGQESWIRLRTETNQYLCAYTAGQPISLTENRELASFFRFEAAPPPRSHLNKQDEAVDWAAGEGHAIEENYSTHLWVFNRVLDLIKEMSKGFMGATLQDVVADEHFRSGIRNGIYDADNGGLYNGATSGFIYSVHFYQPEKKMGGWWDIFPSLAPTPAAMQGVERHALGYGAYYFKRALTETDPQECGYSLGLAIHYLEDLTQPMHCGLYPNMPPELVNVFKYTLAALPVVNSLLWLVGVEIDENWRHDNYELWALGFQDQCKLDARQLNLSEFDGWPIERYFEYAAQRGLAMFNKWWDDPKSPIGKDANGEKHPEQPLPVSFAAGNWQGETKEMLYLAQRLVCGLLFAWAAQAWPAQAWLRAPKLKYICAARVRIPELDYSPANPATVIKQLSDQVQISLPFIWGVNPRGKLVVTWFANNKWQDWKESPDWNGTWNDTPGGVIALAAVNNSLFSRRLQLWALRADFTLFTRFQTGWGIDSSDWGDWSGPDWNGAPKLKRIWATTMQVPQPRLILWGVDVNGKLTWTYFDVRQWTKWSPEPWKDPEMVAGREVIAVAVTPDAEKRLRMWALYDDGTLYGRTQNIATTDGWSVWDGPSWKNSPRLKHICASLVRGAKLYPQVWGITKDNKIVTSALGEYLLEPLDERWPVLPLDPTPRGTYGLTDAPRREDGGLGPRRRWDSFLSMPDVGRRAVE